MRSAPASEVLEGAHAAAAEVIRVARTLPVLGGPARVVLTLLEERQRRWARGAVPDASLLAEQLAELGGAGDQRSVLRVLAGLLYRVSATALHLAAEVPADDARPVVQVMAASGADAALLGRAAEAEPTTLSGPGAVLDRGLAVSKEGGRP